VCLDLSKCAGDPPGDGSSKRNARSGTWKVMEASIRPPDPAIVRSRLDIALAEDGFDRDLSSRAAAGAGSGDGVRRFALVARQEGLFAGAAVLGAVVERFSGQLAIELVTGDGRRFARGECLAIVEGRVGTILALERTLLNFLQRLCGVATLTAEFVRAVEGTDVRIYDTRKTIPGWRELDKYAVRCGGGFNHRFGLHDAVLFKDNHLAGIPAGKLARAVAQMVRRAREADPPPAFVEVEVDSLDQLRQLIEVEGIDLFLLDNFGLEDLRKAAAIRDAARLRGRVELEASGGISLASAGAMARTGIDRLSVGAITHSAPAVDLGLDEHS